MSKSEKQLHDCVWHMQYLPVHACDADSIGLQHDCCVSKFYLPFLWTRNWGRFERKKKKRKKALAQVIYSEPLHDSTGLCHTGPKYILLLIWTVLEVILYAVQSMYYNQDSLRGCSDTPPIYTIV